MKTDRRDARALAEACRLESIGGRTGPSRSSDGFEGSRSHARSPRRRWRDRRVRGTVVDTVTARSAARATPASPRWAAVFHLRYNFARSRSCCASYSDASGARSYSAKRGSRRARASSRAPCSASTRASSSASCFAIATISRRPASVRMKRVRPGRAGRSSSQSARSRRTTSIAALRSIFYLTTSSMIGACVNFHCVSGAALSA